MGPKNKVKLSGNPIIQGLETFGQALPEHPLFHLRLSFHVSGVWNYI
jgi:hypothetical protein